MLVWGGQTLTTVNTKDWKGIDFEPLFRHPLYGIIHIYIIYIYILVCFQGCLSTTRCMCSHKVIIQSIGFSPKVYQICKTCRFCGAERCYLGPKRLTNKIWKHNIEWIGSTSYSSVNLHSQIQSWIIKPPQTTLHEIRGWNFLLTNTSLPTPTYHSSFWCISVTFRPLLSFNKLLPFRAKKPTETECQLHLWMG